MCCNCGIKGQNGKNTYLENGLYLCHSWVKFFTLVCAPKVTQAVPVAVFFPEQEVQTMNECLHKELYLYVQAASHEMTGWYRLFKPSPGTSAVAHTQTCGITSILPSSFSLASLSALLPHSVLPLVSWCVQNFKSVYHCLFNTVSQS